MATVIATIGMTYYWLRLREMYNMSIFEYEDEVYSLEEFIQKNRECFKK